MRGSLVSEISHRNELVDVGRTFAYAVLRQTAVSRPLMPTNGN